jgi:hypothetical protein
MIPDNKTLEELKRIGCMFTDIPQNVFQNLKNESLVLEKDNKPMVSGLTAPGVPTHYYFKRDDNYKLFQYFIEGKARQYLKLFKDSINEFNIFSDKLPPFVLDSPWFNLQHKHQFIPNHHHTGFLSYSGWIQVPYELTNTQDASSTFEFMYPGVNRLTSLSLHVDKSFEGKIIFFPAPLVHCVYPFYSIDIPRISFSGNILFDTSNHKS